MDTRNHEHYKDQTAHDAIKAADRPPENYRLTIRLIRCIARIMGYKVVCRIRLEDMKTKKTY